MKNNFFTLFSCCKFVEGHNRSVICDLQRDIYYPIPNALNYIFENNFTININDVLTKYGQENKKNIIEYLDFLEAKEFGFYGKNDNLKEMNLEYFNDPKLITNCIIEADNFNIDLLDKLIFSLNTQMCESIEIRYYNEIDFEILNSFISKFENSTIRSISLVLKHNIKFTKKSLLDFKINNPRIKSFLVHSAPKNYETITFHYTIIFTKKKLIDNKCCGFIMQKDFITSIKTYSEFTQFNSCLNKKISIDNDGNIKNCPSLPQSFGNIKDITLEEALNHTDIKKYWNVTKDKIDVCKDCEFRYICTDCRAYTERTHFDDGIDLSKPLKCGYNPYTNEWAEWSTNPLKQKAIAFYEM